MSEESMLESTPEKFPSFPKIPRLSRECVITEKLDGTNASIFIGEAGEIKAGSRKRWITPEDDNFYFAAWVRDNKNELLKLGPGHHFGEWWGLGIQRGYGLYERRFSLFNTAKWSDDYARPKCCGVVPLLYMGPFDTETADSFVQALRDYGSQAVPGYMKPEGIVVFHTASRTLFKKTCEHDEKPKGRRE